MKMLFKAAVAAIFTSVIGASASAGTLNISFTGTIDRTNDGGNADVPSIGSLAVGDAVFGGFSLDTSATGIVSGAGTSTSFANAVSGFTMTLDGLAFASTGMDAFEVGDNDMAGSSAPLRDSVLVAAYGVSGPSVSGLTPARIQFALGGTDTSVLSNMNIPTPALLQSLFAADTIGGNLNFLSLSDGSDARFRIDTLTISSVPLPAGLPLLLVGLGGFGALRRRKLRQA